VFPSACIAPEHRSYGARRYFPVAVKSHLDRGEYVLLRDLLIVCTVGFSYHTASSAVKVLVPLYCASLGAPVGMIGIVVGAQSLLPLFLAVPAGGLADRVGFRTVTLVGGFCMCLAAVVFYISGSIYPLITGQVLGGLGELSVWLCAQAAITGIGDSTSKARYLGYFGFAIALGQAAGPGMAGFAADLTGYRNAFLLPLAFSVLVLVAALRMPNIEAGVQAPDESETTGIRDRRGFLAQFAQAGGLLQQPRTRAALLCTFVMIFTKTVRQSFFPVLLRGYGYSASTIGMLVSLMEGSSTVVRLFLGSMLKVLREDTLLLAGMVLGITATTITPLTMSLPLLAIGSLIAGIGVGLNLPLTMSLIAGDAPERLRGLAMGIRLTGNRAAQFVSPVIFGVMGRWLNLGTSFYVVGGLLFLGTAAAGALLRQARQGAQAGEIT